MGMKVSKSVLMILVGLMEFEKELLTESRMECETELAMDSAMDCGTDRLWDENLGTWKEKW